MDAMTRDGIAASESLIGDVAGGVRAALREARFGLDAARYRLQQQALALSAFVGHRLWHLALDPGAPRPSVDAIREIERRYAALLERDLENVRRGCYPRDLLYQLPFFEYLGHVPEVLLDLPRILLRRYRGKFRDLPPWVDRKDYPKYYLRTFHWQTDGWLSERSARLYDATVEFLFGGTADVMRRMAIPPVVESVAGRRRPRILDIACGTGRFLRQLGAALPRAKLYGLDLSPHYLKRAGQVLSGAADVSLAVENAEALPFADGFFDAATSVFLFHELPADARRNVAAEAWRVLKPGGRLVVCDSAQLSDSGEIADFLEAFHRSYHEPYYKGYLRDDLATVLAEAGFEVEESAPWLVSKVVVARKPGTARMQAGRARQ
jgi:ubiquinone/menaquinone biosynthesis C-methylase UbiE